MSAIGTEPAPPRTAAARTAGPLLLGAACLLPGALLALLWLQQRFAPQLLKLPFVPFFDRLALFDRSPGLIAAHGLAALALLVTGAALAARRGFAPWLFAGLGWGGFLFTLAAAWPGDQVRSKVRFAMNVGRQKGSLPADATVLDLVPTEYLVLAALAFGVYVALLVLGTRHVLRNRAVYDR